MDARLLEKKLEAHVPGDAGHVCFQELQIRRDLNNEMMDDPVPLKEVPAGRRVQRVALDPAGRPIRKVNLGAGLA